MSRILARATGAAARTPSVRPRLPMLFEPGLDILVPQTQDDPAAGRADTGAWTAVPEATDRDPASGEHAGWDPPGRRAASPPGLDGDGPGRVLRTSATQPAQVGPGNPARAEPLPGPGNPTAIAARVGDAAMGMRAADPAWPGTEQLAGAAPFGSSARRPAGQKVGDDHVIAGLHGRQQSYPVRPAMPEDGLGTLLVPAARDFPRALSSAGVPAAYAVPAAPGPAAMSASAASPGTPAMPQVRIEIGRVEIRADLPRARQGAPSHPRRTASRQPGTDLGEYLKRRSGRP